MGPEKGSCEVHGNWHCASTWHASVHWHVCQGLVVLESVDAIWRGRKGVCVHSSDVRWFVQARV